jgi:hypothetical protein
MPHRPTRRVLGAVVTPSLGMSARALLLAASVVGCDGASETVTAEANATATSSGSAARGVDRPVLPVGTATVTSEPFGSASAAAETATASANASVSAQASVGAPSAKPPLPRPGRTVPLPGTIERPGPSRKVGIMAAPGFGVAELTASSDRPRRAPRRCTDETSQWRRASAWT